MKHNTQFTIFVQTNTNRAIAGARGEKSECQKKRKTPSAEQWGGGGDEGGGETLDGG